MLKINLLSLMFFVSTIAQAQSLKDVMGAIGGNAKTIAIALKSGALDESALTAVAELKTNVDLAMTFFPDTANTPALQKRYLELMSQLKEQVILLEEEISFALQNDPKNIQKSQDIFSAMMEIRTIGHDEFKLD